MKFKVKYYFLKSNFKMIFFSFTLFFYIFFGNQNLLFSQVEDTVKTQSLPEIHVSKDYFSKYKSTLRRLRKVYPLALYAAKKLKEIDSELVTLESKRKKKRYTKESNLQLRDDFHYVILDLYTSEGILLMKLIHRETGLTVSQIIEKYRGKFRSELNDNLGKLWGQDLDATYNPSGEDWMIENVLHDIHSDIVEFDFEPKLITKEEHKVSKAQYKKAKREAKKNKN